jgi:signal transduction histidine kinase
VAGGGVSGKPATAWQAIARQPWAFLRSSWPWRSAGYLLTSLPVAAIAQSVLLVLVVTGMVTTPVVAGFWLLALVPLTAVALGRVERRRLRWVDVDDLRSPHPPPVGRGVRRRARQRLRERATWREFAYLALFVPVAAADFLIAATGLTVPAALLAAPVMREVIGRPFQLVVTISSEATAAAAAGLGLVACVVAAYLLTAVAAVRAVAARALLAGSREDELQAHVVELTRSRARLAGAFEEERRRLERDLHDGVQQRLTALLMTLGLARVELPDDSEAAGRLLAQAQLDAAETLEELRALVRGIQPSLLTDRGLAGAITAVTERSPIQVDVNINLAVRPPAEVESAVYFAVCEALANVAKHSRAGHGVVSVRSVRSRLVAEVRDDGVGGADPARGSGLSGLADRIAAVGGILTLSSPPGGPTHLRMEIPCEW